MMRLDGTIILGLVALLTGSAFSAEAYRVDKNAQGGTAAPSGDSWRNAFASVQEAIDAAATSGGGEIWVKTGVHKPSGKTRDATIQLAPGIELYGGFRGTETSRLQRNPSANRTILSGDIGRSGFTADNCRHIITGAANCRIDGFIISAGNTTQERGAALLLDPSSKDFTVANCTFEKNHASEGGAIHTAASGTTITNCSFFSNSAETGGAIHIGTGVVFRATDCKFSSNLATQSGGAIAIRSGSNTEIHQVWFLFNRTDGTGGAISITEGNPQTKLTLADCNFNENSATETGGALFNSGAFTSTVSRCRFTKNSSLKGAGIIANQDGATTTLQEPTLVRNRSAKGIPAITIAPTPDVTPPCEEQPQPPPQPQPQPRPKYWLADIPIHDASNARIPLRGLIAKSNYTVLSIGDLTDPAFITSYRNIEAAAKDYSKKGIAFFYVYSHLIHPENHGYVQPLLLPERTRQIQEAQRLFRTQIPWLCDGMDNPVAQALDRTKNNLFIFNKEGEETFAGSMADVDPFREILIELAGSVESPTPARIFTPPELLPIDMPNVEFVKRIKIDPSESSFKALRSTPQKSTKPFYVKLRSEASAQLLETGNGQLYLGFHIDPLYRVAWNNLAQTTLDYVIKVPTKTAIAPSRNQAEKITDTPTDSEPREFLLDIRNWNFKDPLPITINYSILSNRTKSPLTVSQRYLLYLKIDPFGGTVIGRQIPHP